MPTPLEIATKPIVFGLRTAFGLTQTAFHIVQSLTGGAQQPSPPTPESREEQPAASRPAPQRRRPSTRRNTRPKQLDDVSITRKVETELFRDRKIAKGKISVNTAEGVVFLRGEAKNPEQINEIERRVSEVPEVNGVENLLHLPKTPAPTRADTPVEQQHTRRHKTSPADRPVTGRVNAERKPKRGEAAPSDLAKTHKGRQPAPLGSHVPEGAKGSVNEEQPVKGAEPGPREAAAKGRGRQAAPLGSEGDGSS
jgi:hypothetical protein